MVTGPFKNEYQNLHHWVLPMQKGCRRHAVMGEMSFVKVYMWLEMAGSYHRCVTGVRFWKVLHSGTLGTRLRAWGLKSCGSHYFPGPEDSVSWTEWRLAIPASEMLLYYSWSELQLSSGKLLAPGPKSREGAPLCHRHRLGDLCVCWAMMPKWFNAGFSQTTWLGQNYSSPIHF